MFRKRFFLSWIFASVGMFMLSYFWHGFILSDFSSLTYPIRLFTLVAVLIYLVVGYTVTRCFNIPYLATTYKKRPLKRGFWGGALVGLALFIITTIIGFSFNNGHSFKHLLYDAVWQIIEQGFGGIIVAFGHIFIYESDDSMD